MLFNTTLNDKTRPVYLEEMKKAKVDKPLIAMRRDLLFPGDHEEEYKEAEGSVRMAEALESGGSRVTLRLLNGWGHNDGIDEAYLHTDLIDWLLEKRRTDFSAPPEFCYEWF